MSAGAVARQLSIQRVDSECLGCAGLGFLVFSWSVYDQPTPALRLLEPLLHWERPHTPPGPRSNGNKDINLPGLRSCESSGFRGDATQNYMNHTTGSDQQPVHVLLPSRFWTLVMNSWGPLEERRACGTSLRSS